MEELESDKVMQVAEAKQQLYLTMETKDQELETIRSTCQTLRADNEQLTDNIHKLEKNGRGLIL